MRRYFMNQSTYALLPQYSCRMIIGKGSPAAKVQAILSATILALLVLNCRFAFGYDSNADMHRVTSVKNWLDSLRDYQWLDDGRILFWLDNRDHPSAFILDPRTGV